MKRFALALAAVVSLAVSANAADVARPRYAAPAYNAAAFNWTGFYAGLNVGHASSTYEDNYTSGSYTNDLSMAAKGWQYEVDAMYLHQFANHFVLGAKTAFNFGGGTGSQTVDNCPGCGIFGYSDTTTTTVKKKWSGSTEAILGYSMMNDKLLAYGGIGVDYGKFQVDSVENWSGFGYSGSYTNSATSYGAGLVWEVGLMYSINSNLIAKAFYRDSNYNIDSHDYGAYATASTKYHDKAVFAGLSYKF